MPYIRQDVFSVGEVDEINFNETSSALYLKSLKSALNFLITDTGKATKRTGFKNINSLSSEPVGALITPNTRLFNFLAADGQYYIIFATNLLFSFYKISTNAFVAPVVTPYTEAQLGDLQATNGENNIIFVHPEHIPARLDEIAGVFSYLPFVFAVQPSFDFGKVVYNPSTAVMAGGTTATFTLTLASPAPAFTADWIGGIVIGGGANANDPIGYGIITSVAVAVTTIIKGTVKIQFKDVLLAAGFKGSDYSIRQPVFTTALGFPGSVIFYQNRIWFGNTKSLKNTMFGSKINQFDNFDVGVGNPPDAIVYTIGDTNTGEIIFLNAGKQIEIYTRNIEYVAPQPQGEALTPSTFSIRPQSSYGVSDLCEPISYENDSYFIGRGGKSLFRFQFQGLGEAYLAENISVASAHLIKQPRRRAIVQSTVNSQENYLFYLNPDSTLTVYQFSDIANINAFTPLQVGNGIATGDIIIGDSVLVFDIIDVDNKIYMLVSLPQSLKFILVRFDEDVYHDFYQVKNLPLNGIVTGLTDYEGYTVSVAFNGQDFGDYKVAGGSITVVIPPSFVPGDSTIGFTYDAELKPLSIFDGERLTDAFKKTSYVYVDFFQTIDFRLNGKLVPYQTFAEIQAGDPLMPKTGRVRLGTGNGYQLTEDVTISQSTPLSLTILAISYQVEGELI